MGTWKLVTNQVRFLLSTSEMTQGENWDSLVCDYNNWHACHFINIASQMWLLGRLLPLMVAHLVPKENSKWKSFLLLLKIMDYLLSPVISDDDCIYLKVYKIYYNFKL